MAFHLEAWYPDDGRPVFCEIASRPGGAYVIPMFRTAFGVDLSRVNYRGQAGLPIDLGDSAIRPRAAVGGIVVAPGHGMFTPPPSGPPIALEWSEWGLAPGDRRSGPRYGGDGAFICVVSATTHEALRERIADTVAWWREGVSWS
jgi:hypothetical protein